jgi:DNA-binding LacI/PurR family transcriptional regulator
LSKGHRRIALIVPNSGLAGDLASERGFQEGAEPRDGREDVRVVIVRHNGSAENIVAKLDVLFDSPNAPTALLVAKVWHVLVVQVYLLKRGLSIPEHVALVCRDADPFFEFTVPAIAHYRFSGNVYVHRLSHLMLKLVSYGYVSEKPNLIFPRFFEGGTAKGPRPSRAVD